MKHIKHLGPALRSAGRLQSAANDGSGSVAETIRLALVSAGIDADGPYKDVSRTIADALAAAGFVQPTRAPDRPGGRVDAAAREAGRPREIAPDDSAEFGNSGQFSTHSFSNAAGTRSYKLYVPAGVAAGATDPVPLLIMLHGCTQSPDDFAAGTQMNALADEHGFVVAYPAQAANANGSHCWNWFRSEDQQRDAGEPSLIAGITREVASRQPIDPRRIFVAGFSAGGSMAVILGVTYPDLYAAIGAHSGLAYAAAHDMASAFQAMQHGSGPAKPTGWPHVAANSATRKVPTRVATIVFHGDRDPTIAARNGAEIVTQAAAGGRLKPVVEEGGSPDRRYRRTVYRDASGRHLVEDWVIFGAGHTWSGGSPQGSYTEASGPDASAEMIRFFLDQPTTAGV